MTSACSPGKPSWLARLPAGADALCVAASIERNVADCGDWGAAIEQARAAGFGVDTDYLRDRYRLVRDFPRVREGALRSEREARRK